MSSPSTNLSTLIPSEVADGTPRDCATPACGAEADTSIIRSSELGTSKATALGRTQGGGPVDAATMIANFMDTAAGNTTSAKAARAEHLAARALYDVADLHKRASSGTKTPAGTTETAVQASAGQGATSGLPTTSDSGVVTMTFHQVNQVRLSTC